MLVLLTRTCEKRENSCIYQLIDVGIQLQLKRFLDFDAPSPKDTSPALYVNEKKKKKKKKKKREKKLSKESTVIY
jgi:hypothetical protein